MTLFKTLFVAGLVALALASSSAVKAHDDVPEVDVYSVDYYANANTQARPTPRCGSPTPERRTTPAIRGRKQRAFAR